MMSCLNVLLAKRSNKMVLRLRKLDAPEHQLNSSKIVKVSVPGTIR